LNTKSVSNRKIRINVNNTLFSRELHIFRAKSEIEYKLTSSQIKYSALY